jgi:hypothetical protein
MTELSPDDGVSTSLLIVSFCPGSSGNVWICSFRDSKIGERHTEMCDQTGVRRIHKPRSPQIVQRSIHSTTSVQRTPHNLGNGLRELEPDERSVVTDENSATRTSRAVAVQILRDGLADVCRQRQLCPYCTFSADRDPSALPIDVLKIQSSDFACPKTKSCQQKQDGIIASTSGGRLVAAVQHSLNFNRRKMFRQTGQCPPGHPGHSRFQIGD